LAEATDIVERLGDDAAGGVGDGGEFTGEIVSVGEGVVGGADRFGEGDHSAELVIAVGLAAYTIAHARHATVVVRRRAGAVGECDGRCGNGSGARGGVGELVEPVEAVVGIVRDDAAGIGARSSRARVVVSVIHGAGLGRGGGFQAAQ